MENVKDSQILNSCRAGKLLKYRQINSVRLKCTLNLNLLFPTCRQLDEFDRKWNKFKKSHPQRDRVIFQRKGKHLIYFSEQLIPAKKDSRRRKPLLLLLGNPASHSVKAGMFFASEGKERKEQGHRFWKQILRPALIPRLPLNEDNDKRRTRLLSADYESDYRIGLAVFLSFPSPASGKWSGVAGVRKLFGKEALDKIITVETERISKCAKEFLSPHGAVVCFNKLAWDELRSPGDKPYSLERAKRYKLSGNLKGGKSFPLFCVPPTRLAGQAGKVLSCFAKSYFVPRS